MTDRERLIELLVNSIANRLGTVFRENVEDIADDLLSNGVVLLPCKMGQKLYDVTEFFNGCLYPEMYEMLSNEMYLERTDKDTIVFTYDGMYIKHEDIGKTVFLTKEEAEQALKEREQV